MRLFAAMLLVLPVSGIIAAEPGTMTVLSEVFGPVDCGDAIGNGRLTAAFSYTGRIASIHWPSPGYFDQITYSMKADSTGRLFVPEGHGICWATRSEKGFSWEIEENINECMTYEAQVGRRATPPAGSYLSCLVGCGGQTGTPTFFIHGDRDILVARFLPNPGSAPSNTYCFANFTPCARLIPELPIADSTFDYANDFAVFTPDNGRTIVHFRPTDIRGADWDQARRLALLGGAEPGWLDFEEGVWIAVGSPDAPTGFQCGVSGTDSSAFTQVKSGALQGQTAAVGDCDSAFEFTCPPPSDTDNPAPVTVFIAFGNTYTEATDALDYARSAGYDRLLQEAAQRLAERVKPTRPGIPYGDKMLEVLLTCMDRETAAMVRMPLAQPPLHVDTPRTGVIGAYALSVAGHHDLVRKRIDFYLNAIRTESTPGRPAGSIPAGLYANGQEAVPHAILDAEAVAWVLWLCEIHAQTLEPDERGTFVTTAWPKIELAAEFLAAWTDPRTGLPRTAFNPQKLRDDQTPGLVLRTYMGLNSALALAKLNAEERPEWRKRVQELETVIRAQYIGPDGFWRIPRPELYWNIALVPDTHPRWQSTLEESVTALYVTTPPPVVASEIVFAASVIPGAGPLARQRAGNLLETRQFDNLLMPPALDINSCVPDSYIAALLYVPWVRLTEPVTSFDLPPIATPQ